MIDKKILVALFAAMLLLQAGAYLVNDYRCRDAVDVYTLSALIADEGPLHYLSSYNQLHTNATDPYGEYVHSALHPPLLPLYYSLSIYAFGPSSFDSLRFTILHWLLVSFTPVVMYLLLRKYFKRRTSLATTALFMLVPVFLIYTATAVQETVMPLLFLVCAYVMLTAIEKDSDRLLAVTGILVSVAFLVKFTAFVLFVPFVLIILFKYKVRGLHKFLYLVLPSLVLPLLLWIAFGYNLVANMAISKAINAGYIATHLLAEPFVPLIYVYYLAYLGLPLVLLVIYGFVRVLNHTKPELPSISLAFVLMFIISLSILYGNFIKQVTASFFLLCIPVAYGLRGMRSRYIVACAILMVINFIGLVIW